VIEKSVAHDAMVMDAKSAAIDLIVIRSRDPIEPSQRTGLRATSQRVRNRPPL
jgi:hypothetical protein